MPLINCKIVLMLIWSSTCVIFILTCVYSTGAGSFAISDTNLHVPVVTLSTQDNEKLLEQLQSGFKRVINWNKYLSKPELLNLLVEPSFQGVNRLFVLAFENDTQRTSYTSSYLPNVEKTLEKLL